MNHRQIRGNAHSGVHVGADEASFTGNGGFGLMCPPSAAVTCVGNDLSGNSLGPTDGCAPDCDAP